MWFQYADWVFLDKACAWSFCHCFGIPKSVIGVTWSVLKPTCPKKRFVSECRNQGICEQSTWLIILFECWNLKCDNIMWSCGTCPHGQPCLMAASRILTWLVQLSKLSQPFLDRGRERESVLARAARNWGSQVLHGFQWPRFLQLDFLVNEHSKPLHSQMLCVDNSLIDSREALSYPRIFLVLQVLSNISLEILAASWHCTKSYLCPWVNAVPFPLSFSNEDLRNNQAMNNQEKTTLWIYVCIVKIIKTS